MNRAQKRKLAKRLKLDYDSVCLIEEVVNAAEEVTDKTDFVGGERVVVKTEEIMSRPEWERQDPKYRELVNDSEGVVSADAATASISYWRAKSAARAL